MKTVLNPFTGRLQLLNGATDVSGGATIPTGMMMPRLVAGALDGWVLAAGGTIGNATSGATERAHADTANLYALLWDGWFNDYAPVSGGRGASAAEDFAAGKALILPDFRGKIPVPQAQQNVFNQSLGATVGSETHILSETEMPIHTHSIPAPDQTPGFSGGGDGTVIGTLNGSTSSGSAGGGEAHNNIQPSMVVAGIYIKL